MLKKIVLADKIRNKQEMNIVDGYPRITGTSIFFYTRILTERV